MSRLLQQHLAQRETSGARTGIYSVCSAHPLVVRAAAEQARQDGTLLLIEATSNQVNQFGGYTGMRPSNFRDFVRQLVDEAGFDPTRLILGGDHLGPNPWRKLPAAEAMNHAIAMITEYVQAGFTKIHLDASMACAGDPTRLPDEMVAERAAQMCAAAEQARINDEPLLYIIGTEVPVPGGADHDLDGLAVTAPASAQHTLQVHKDFFSQHGLAAVWERVLALVVQPGVEFDHDSVIDYDRAKASTLAAWRQSSSEPILFEAHSTDYQNPLAYVDLVEDGFAILKVGPALTFALREALDALEDMETQLVPQEQRSKLRAVVDAVMLTEPDNWLPYYRGTADEQQFLRHYSYSDRVRYYWNNAKVRAATERLISSTNAHPIPETMLSRYLPLQYRRVREGIISADPESLIVDKIRDVLRDYAAACLNGNTVQN